MLNFADTDTAPAHVQSALVKLMAENREVPFTLLQADDGQYCIAQNHGEKIYVFKNNQIERAA